MIGKTFLLITAADPGLVLFYVLAGVTAVLLFSLIVLVEATAMQWVGWDHRNGCLKASLIMNLASVLPAAASIYLVIQWRLAGMAFAWLISVLIEGGTLAYLGRGEPRANWLSALMANLASYLIILLPAYLIGAPHG